VEKDSEEKGEVYERVLEKPQKKDGRADTKWRQGKKINRADRV